MKRLEKGFTLIELMIVVAIIAILAAVAAPRFGSQIAKARDAKAIEIVGTYRSALNLDYADRLEYATKLTDLDNEIDSKTRDKVTAVSGSDTDATTAAGSPKTIQFGLTTTTSAVGLTETSITISTGVTNASGVTWSSI